MIEQLQLHEFPSTQGWAASEEWLFGKIPSDMTPEGPDMTAASPWFAFNRIDGTYYALSSKTMNVLRRVQGLESIEEYTPVHRQLQKAQILLAPGTEKVMEISPNTSVHVWLKITNMCQSGCSFCFDGQDDPEIIKLHTALSRKQTMAPDTIDQIAAQVLHHAKKRDKTEVKWKIAGGEPTLVPDTIFQVIETTRRIGSPEIAQSYHLVTNGINLTRELIECLKAAKVDIALSLGGWAEIHDRTRPLKGGQGSFVKVFESLRRIKESGIKHSVSIVATKHNAEHLGEFARLLYEAFGWTDLELAFVRSNPHESDDATPDMKKLIAGVKALYFQRYHQALREHQPLPRQGLLDYYLVDAIRNEVCGAGNNYLVYGPDRLESCHMLLLNRKPSNQIDSKVDPFTATRNSHPVPLELRRVDDRPNSCATCFQNNQCVGGGCQLHQMHALGSYVPSKPIYCDAYMELGPLWMALKAAVDLKQGNIPYIE
jgi:uncharacterized protein